MTSYLLNARSGIVYVLTWAAFAALYLAGRTGGRDHESSVGLGKAAMIGLAKHLLGID